MNVRSLLPLSLLMLPMTLGACSGLGHFFGDTSGIDLNRNAPNNTSDNSRRAWGETVDTPAIRPENGDVWPGTPKAEPSLDDIANNPNAYPPPHLELEAGTPHAQPRPAGADATVTRLPSVRSAAPLTSPSSRTAPENFHIITKPDGSSGGVVIPNANGTSTIIAPDGKVSTIPTPR